MSSSQTNQSTFSTFGGGASDTDRSDRTCPTCGRDDFASQHGMKVHHTKIHGESIAGVEVECEWCGTPKNVKKNRAQQITNHFCGLSCYGKWQSDNLIGEDHPLRERTEVSCEWCGNLKQIQPHQAGGYTNHFCDQSCFGKWQSENLIGEEAPNWKGGRKKSYGPTWDRQRQAALARDNHTCQLCNISADFHRNLFGRGLSVHHIVPLRTFEDSKTANELTNLLTVCRSCHMRVEHNDELLPEAHSPIGSEALADV